MSSDVQGDSELNQSAGNGSQSRQDARSVDIQIEELRLKYDFRKFVLGSVVVVLIAALIQAGVAITQARIDAQQNQHELAQARLQVNQEYVGRFIDKGIDEKVVS